MQKIVRIQTTNVTLLDLPDIETLTKDTQKKNRIGTEKPNARIALAGLQTVLAELQILRIANAKSEQELKNAGEVIAFLLGQAQRQETDLLNTIGIGNELVYLRRKLEIY
jgi:hypothetical protein